VGLTDTMTTVKSTGNMEFKTGYDSWNADHKTYKNISIISNKL